MFCFVIFVSEAEAEAEEAEEEKTPFLYCVGTFRLEPTFPFAFDSCNDFEFLEMVDEVSAISLEGLERKCRNIL